MEAMLHNCGEARQLVDASAWVDGVSMPVVAEETPADARALLREHGDAVRHRGVLVTLLGDLGPRR